MITAPPPLNRQPTGLLGFLGIKNGGKNPQTLAEVLAPTLELSDLYFKAGQSAETGAGAVNSSTGNHYFLGATAANASQVLLVHYAGIETEQLIVNQEIGITWRITDQAQLVAAPIGVDASLVSNAGGTTRMITGILGPVLLYPGQLLGFSVTRLVLAAQPDITFNWYAHYTILPI